jgi:hypothetical protein
MSLQIETWAKAWSFAVLKVKVDDRDPIAAIEAVRRGAYGSQDDAAAARALALSIAPRMTLHQPIEVR